MPHLCGLGLGLLGHASGLILHRGALGLDGRLQLRLGVRLRVQRHLPTRTHTSTSNDTHKSERIDVSISICHVIQG